MIELFKPKRKLDITDDYLSEIDLEKEKLAEERNLVIFEAIVGSKNMEQIDYIIENGIERYDYWLRGYERRTLYSPATVKEALRPFPQDMNDTFNTSYVRGGRGNAKLLSWNYHYTAE